MDPAQGLDRLVRAEACCIAYQHLCQADDGIQGRAKLMAHIGEETGLVRLIASA